MKYICVHIWNSKCVIDWLAKHILTKTIESRQKATVVCA
jgi:hypothetical protein